MNPSKIITVFSAVLSISTFFAGSRVHAQLVTIETVPVGDPRNVAYRSSGSEAIGSVPYTYEIGKYEVTLSQYAVFLNSVAKFNGASYLVSLWNSQLEFDDNVAGIARTGTGAVVDPYVYTVIGDGRRPVSNLSWFDAARFANWVNNGATAGASTETGSYTLNGASSVLMIDPNASAVWRLPNADEWFKAAYYKGGGTNAGYWRYATRSDVSPGNVVGAGTNQANYRVRDRYAVTQSATLESDRNYLTAVGAFTRSASSYNTFDQTGNVTEWTDGLFVFAPPGEPREVLRAAFGGAWDSNFDASSFEATAVDRNARFGAAPETAVFGFRLVKLSSGGPTPSPTPTPPAPKQQRVTFKLPPKLVYDGTYTLRSVFSSKGPVTYAVNDSTIATVSGNQLKILKAGLAFNVTASNAGDSTWAAAQSLPASGIAAKSPQKIAFTPKSAQTAGGNFNLLATVNSPLPIAVASDKPEVVRVNGDGTATALAKGSAVLTATQGGNENYAPAKPVKKTIVVK